MTTESLAQPAANPMADGWPGVGADFGPDKQAFVVPWGKAMMWIFLLSDTFIFSCFLTSYMHVRISTTVPWPNPSEVFALQHRRATHPADPDRDHDLHPDQQQRHHGDGRELRLPARSRPHRGADADHRRASARRSSACRPSSGPS